MDIETFGEYCASFEKEYLEILVNPFEFFKAKISPKKRDEVSRMFAVDIWDRAIERIARFQSTINILEGKANLSIHPLILLGRAAIVNGIDMNSIQDVNLLLLGIAACDYMCDYMEEKDIAAAHSATHYKFYENFFEAKYLKDIPEIALNMEEIHDLDLELKSAGHLFEKELWEIASEANEQEGTRLLDYMNKNDEKYFDCGGEEQLFVKEQLARYVFEYMVRKRLKKLT